MAEKRAMNAKFHKKRGFLKKYYRILRFFLNNPMYICDIMFRKPAKPLSSDMLNLVGVSFCGEQ